RNKICALGNTVSIGILRTKEELIGATSLKGISYDQTIPIKSTTSSWLFSLYEKVEGTLKVHHLTNMGVGTTSFLLYLLTEFAFDSCSGSLKQWGARRLMLKLRPAHSRERGSSRKAHVITAHS
ncbi:hypothetical protein AMTR_s00115p00099320, partial [Amborella trichopoda]